MILYDKSKKKCVALITRNKKLNILLVGRSATSYHTTDQQVLATWLGQA